MGDESYFLTTYNPTERNLACKKCTLNAVRNFMSPAAFAGHGQWNAKRMCTIWRSIY